MAEIKFKYTKSDDFEGKTLNDGDLIAYNSEFGETTPNSTNDKLGSTYRGTHIIGTTEAEKLCLNEAIKVMGVTVGNLKDGTTITKGTSLQQILEQILCKTIDVVANAPTASMTNGSVNVEYGSSVAATPVTITLTQGKFTAAEAGWTTNQLMDCKLASASINGTAASLSEDHMSASYTIPGFVCTSTQKFTGAATVTANTVVPTKNNGAASDKAYAGGAITVSGAKTWTPIYKAYVGYSEALTVEELNSTSIRALNAAIKDVPMSASSQTMISGAVKSNGKSIVVACPPGYKLTGIQNGLGASIVGSFTKTGSVTVNCANNPDAAKTYNVFVYPIANGSVVEYKNVTIGKA